MNEYILFLIAALLALCSSVFSGLAHADSHPYEFHADARMAHELYGPVDKTYGYMYVLTDRNGKGTINVMFSNGNEASWARFNARVRLVDATGAVVREELFESWLDAADFGEATERRISKALEGVDFETVRVDFYLSDISDRYTSAAKAGH